jgi:hypothetical protein
MAEIDEEQTSRRANSPHGNQFAARSQDQSQAAPLSIALHHQTDELQSDLSQLRTTSQLEQLIDYHSDYVDDDVTQISSSQVEYNC